MQRGSASCTPLGLNRVQAHMNRSHGCKTAMSGYYTVQSSVRATDREAGECPGAAQHGQPEAAAAVDMGDEDDDMDGGDGDGGGGDVPDDDSSLGGTDSCIRNLSSQRFRI